MQMKKKEVNLYNIKHLMKMQIMFNVSRNQSFSIKVMSSPLVPGYFKKPQIKILQIGRWMTVSDQMPNQRQRRHRKETSSVEDHPEERLRKNIMNRLKMPCTLNYVKI